MDLSSLNDKQLEAVTAPLGPVLVLAGAGSGKTRVLAYRIAYLIDKDLIDAGRILSLTFTNKAAKEMQERVVALLGASKKALAKSHAMPNMGTFHSVCARILRQEIVALGYTRGFVIYDSDDQLKIIREISDEMGLGKKFPPTLFRAYIGAAKNIVQTPGEFNIGLESGMHSMVQKVYTLYQNYLYTQNGVDFDDLLMLTIKLFQLRPDILKKYQELFAYVLVDEYQDTNHAQYVLLQLLASHRNLFVVGDDAQSIYGFRGSNIGNILSFEKDYPDALVVKLEQNYRSTKNILAVAEKVIAMNPEQKSKKLWTENERGPKIKVMEVESERAEGAFVARTIIKLATGADDVAEAGGDSEFYEEESQPEPVNQGFSILDTFLNKQRAATSRNGFGGGGFGFSVPQMPKVHDSLKKFAVLYRTHAQSRALEEMLIQAAIPYQIIGGVKFYERKEIKDMLAYLRLIQNYRDLVSLKRVINEPARGIGDKSYQIIKQFMVASRRDLDLKVFREVLPTVKLPPKQHVATLQFFWLIEDLGMLESEESLVSLLRLVFKKSGMEKWLNDGTEVGEIRSDNVKELFNVAAKFEGKPWIEALSEFLEEVALVTEVDSMQESSDMVTLMTLHSAKGLEFDVVFFVGLEEGILPHSRSLLNPAELSEEVRLAYVGITRARQQLYLLYARHRSLFGNTQAAIPSRILHALPEEHIEVQGSFQKRGWGAGTSELTYESEDF